KGFSNLKAGVETIVMSKTRLAKFSALVASLVWIGVTVQARPEYLKLYAADPFSRPELRTKCSLCHINPEGGGPRNDFGKAFASGGLKITADLRKQFPENFVSPDEMQKPPVSFVEGSDAEAIVEINGKKFVINTKSKTVTELDADKAPAQIATAAPAKQQ